MRDPAPNDAGAVEPNTHAFVIKVWREDGDLAVDSAAWRGHITHVASGQRRYVTSLRELDSFIGGYLQELYIRLPLVWRMYQWINLRLGRR
jgi:hypothetical protein